MQSNTELNEVTLNKLKLRIFQMIRENHKTKKLNYAELNERIRKMIEGVVDYDN